MTQPGEIIAPPKPFPPKKLRRTLYWLALDWIHLHAVLPSPTKGEKTRQSNLKDFGHPTEWASDKAAEIAAILASWHDLLAEHRGETPPTKAIVFGVESIFAAVIRAPVSEQRRVITAWKYLEPRCEELAHLVAAEALSELPTLHGVIRTALGHYTPKYTLPIPCPNSACGLRTLVRVPTPGLDFISCDSCGYTVKEIHYPFLIRITLDAVLANNA